MQIPAILVLSILSVSSVTITEPLDGETYDGDWLPLRAIVENENEVPDSVHYSLNGQTTVLIPRLNTDWYTYMANDCRLGYSESPAPHDNTVLWTAPVTGMGHEFVSPVIVDGRVYHASEEQEIAFCLDAATGVEIWRFENIGDSIDDALHVKDGKAYLASDSIWCLDAYTGNRIWAFGVGGEFGFNGPPTVYEDKVIVSDWTYNIVYGLDIGTGEVVWSTDTLTFCVSTLTAWNNMVFVPSGTGHLRAFSTETGQVEWIADGSGTFWDSSPTVIDGEIYIGNTDGTLYRLNASNGDIINEFSWPPYQTIESTPAIHNDYVLTDLAHFVYAVDRFTGIPKWIFSTGEDRLHASVGIADGIVFWGDKDTSGDSLALIHAVDEETGVELWNYAISGSNRSCPAIVDGIMYIGAGDGNLYAFGTGLKYTYREDNFYADIGSNELIVTSFDEGTVVAADTISFTVTQTGITLEPSRVFNLSVIPNPFYSNALISFELTEQARTEVEIFDLTGRSIASLSNADMVRGVHSMKWNGCNQSGEAVSAGLYLCRIESGGIIETIGLCLLR